MCARACDVLSHVVGKRLQQLLGVAALDAQGDVPDVPRVGSELTSIVSVLLKTVDEKYGTVSVAMLSHQARARRDLVVELMLGTKQRGYRAHCKVVIDTVKAVGQMLPEHGVLPELIRTVEQYWTGAPEARVKNSWNRSVNYKLQRWNTGFANGYTDLNRY